jgi:YD repeat-containing protein
MKGGSILKYNNEGKISEQYIFDSQVPVTPQAYTVAATIPSYYEKKLSIIYDADSKNQLELQPVDNTKKVFLWSYRNQFPVAEIQNADYQTVELVLGAANILNFKNGHPGEIELSNFLAPLRTDSRLSMAKITTYSYSPLLGLLTQRDERNLLTKYEYDSLGRLLRIRDHQNNILKQYDYKFKINTDAQPQ